MLVGQTLPKTRRLGRRLIQHDHGRLHLCIVRRLDPFIDLIENRCLCSANDPTRRNYPFHRHLGKTPYTRESKTVRGWSESILRVAFSTEGGRQIPNGRCQHKRDTRYKIQEQSPGTLTRRCCR